MLGQRLKQLENLWRVRSYSTTEAWLMVLPHTRCIFRWHVPQYMHYLRFEACDLESLLVVRAKSAQILSWLDCAWSHFKFHRILVHHVH